MRPKATEFCTITQTWGLLRRSRSRTNRKLICDFLLVSNTNLPVILHCFRDIAFDRSKIATLGYPSCVKPSHRQRGSLGRSPQNFIWMSTDGQGTKWRRNITENFNWLSRAHERYRQTDGRQMRDRQIYDDINN